MSKKEKTVRAWKDPQFRAGLTPDEKKNLPEHPAGDGALDDDDLEKAAGGLDLPVGSGGWVCTLTTECGCPWGN
ncbi:MAG TPA: mersacidin/lichenicidin family type 2 lantibiotic [Vicinamibacteria bacterium]|nr:mersacidin/lichenicidin family type 2 lantibiotic [Vicinamibacteria bacterium]